ncbi:MAG TPA: hypothetical protein PLZ05_03215, partial [Alphaproteobacteria bacterium]|nr:hypothetical protein [Alphaproteobacteria bacterium]
MKSLTRFFALILCIVPHALFADAPVSGTVGDSMTAYSGGMGSINNNNWNQMMNSRSNMPSADFGNCNALILRCATPKCSGCTTIDIATPIVQGCVLSNDTCKKYGNDLVQYISAQIVSNTTAKASEANAAAAREAAEQASQQSAQQMQQMQSQMQQLQNQISEQNNQTAATVQAALDEQKQLAAQQAADAATAQAVATQSTNITQAANNGVSAEVLAREQASGQIMSQLESANDSLVALKKTMQNTFDYAGCDSFGNNCVGPKRVAAFKQKAGEFFEPYENTLDNVYDALIMAQSLGVDITDIYMMLNGSCNVWGKYLCTNGAEMRYTTKNCQPVSKNSSDYKSVTVNNVIGSQPCKVGDIIPLNDGGCQLLKMLTSQDEVQQDWLYPEQNTDKSGKVLSQIQVGCASEALDNSKLFRNRKKQATIDIEVLQRIIDQDAPKVFKDAKNDAIIYCSDTDVVTDLQNLQQLTSLKKLPGKVCVDQFGKIGFTASSNNGCDDEKNMYINPLIAMCSTHVYNIGLDKNPTATDTADRQNMKDIIALKTTIMTQQMKKQYDYLETTIKRFKTQLEKAILTNKMEASGASSESGYASNSKVSMGDDCTGKNRTDTVYCLRQNYAKMRSALDSKNYSNELKEQIVKDSKALNYMSSELMKDGSEAGKCRDKSNLNVSSISGCLGYISGA